MSVSKYAGANGTVQIVKGAIEAKNASTGFDLVVGDKGAGSLYMLDRTVSSPALTGVHNLTVGGTGSQDVLAVFRGHRPVSVVNGGILTNNGEVCAYGWGNLQYHYVLDLSGFSAVGNKIENTVGNGWYAQAGGKLVLPHLPIVSDTWYNWGEAPYGTLEGQDAEIDLVNSVQMRLDATGSGAYELQISLLAGDRLTTDEVYTTLPDPQEYTVVGIWEFAFASAGAYGDFTSGDLVFRYDDGHGDFNGIEPELLYYNSSGVWVPVPDDYSVDAVNRRISVYREDNPFVGQKTYYAVVYPVGGGSSSRSAAGEAAAVARYPRGYEPQWIQALQEVGQLEAWEESLVP